LDQHLSSTRGMRRRRIWRCHQQLKLTGTDNLAQKYPNNLISTFNTQSKAKGIDKIIGKSYDCSWWKEEPLIQWKILSFFTGEIPRNYKILILNEIWSFTAKMKVYNEWPKSKHWKNIDVRAKNLGGKRQQPPKSSRW
jgi:hypothetical protein